MSKLVGTVILPGIILIVSFFIYDFVGDTIREETNSGLSYKADGFELFPILLTIVLLPLTMAVVYGISALRKNSKWLAITIGVFYLIVILFMLLLATFFGGWGGAVTSAIPNIFILVLVITLLQWTQKSKHNK